MQAEDITELLEAAGRGEAEASEQLYRMVYPDLHLIARRHLRGADEAAPRATSLVHETYMRLARAGGYGYRDRGHFFCTASRAMRQVLIDRARMRLAGKRGGGRADLDIDEVQAAGDGPDLDLMALGEALADLEREDAELAKLVEWRFFGGLTLLEGEVWRARRNDAGFEQVAALKLLKRGMDSEALTERLVRERRILARLEHPIMARLLDGGMTGSGRPCFAMELVEGQPIDEFVQQRGLGIKAMLRLFLRICAAVDFAHRNLVVHRDLKPSNILVDAEGEPKLLDFGIAKPHRCCGRSAGRGLAGGRTGGGTVAGAGRQPGASTYGSGVSSEFRRAEAAKSFLIGLFEYTNPGAVAADATRSVRDLLMSSDESIEQRLADQPLVQAELRIAVAAALRSYGEAETAMALTETAVAQLRAHPDASPVALAIRLHS
jgi:RNA polymerase sigma factor (TIGR02999 family)